ncbi:MAG: nucleotide exchange factor GrpE [Bacteroidetes bacterium]|nr:MAG: nucleotide exchange factor GrpE [Bacteroidota bacterium]
MTTEKDYIEDEAQQEQMTDNSVEKQEEKSDKTKKRKASKKKVKLKKESKEDKMKREIEELNEKNEHIHDDYLRLFSEFDNFRKRKNKEIADLYITAGEKIVLSILPIIDDFERAIQHAGDSDEAQAHREGMDLIYNKFLNILKQNGVQEIEAKGELFDTDFHEAITHFPAPSNDLKGKVVDVTEKGYTMGDKVIRYAKVVVGD